MLAFIGGIVLSSVIGVGTWAFVDAILKDIHRFGYGPITEPTSILLMLIVGIAILALGFLGLVSIICGLDDIL